MVGNDIVDLGDPEAQPETLHPRFDGRVFTVDERRVIDGHNSANEMRWITWACKESAYKLVKREIPSTVFSQREFRVEMASLGSARVRHLERTIDVRISRHGSAIHAIATHMGDAESMVISAVGTTTSNTSDAVRELARGRLADAFSCPPREIEFSSGRGRIPEVLVGGEEPAAMISFSHHGRFVAFACRLR